MEKNYTIFPQTDFVAIEVICLDALIARFFEEIPRGALVETGRHLGRKKEVQSGTCIFPSMRSENPPDC